MTSALIRAVSHLRSRHPAARRSIRLCLAASLGLCPVSPALAEDGYRLITPSGSSRLVSADIQDTDIRLALSALAEVGGANIAFQRDISGQIRALHVSGVPAEQVFRALLRMNNLYAEGVGNIVIVYPIEQYIRDARERARLANQ